MIVIIFSLQGNDNEEEVGSGHGSEVVGLQEREAQRDSGKGVRVLQCKARASTPLEIMKDEHRELWMRQLIGLVREANIRVVFMCYSSTLFL